MAVPTYVAADISADWDRGAIMNQFAAGVALTIGQAVYVDSNDLLQLAIASASLTARVIGLVVGSPHFAYGQTTIAAGEFATICVLGPVWGFSALVAGTVYWIDKTTAGALTDTAPTAAYQFALGRAESSDTFFVYPGVSAPVSA